MTDMLDMPKTAEEDDDPNLVEEFSKIIRDYRIAMNEFNDGVKRRESLSLRAERRNGLIYQVSLFSVFLLFVLVVFLIYTLKANTQVMATQVDTMNQNMVAIASHVENVQQTMQAVGTNVQLINTHLQNMPEVTQLAVGLEQDLAVMQEAMHNINTALGQVNSAVMTAQTDMEAMNENLTSLQKSSDVRPAYQYYRY